MILARLKNLIAPKQVPPPQPTNDFDREAESWLEKLRSIRQELEADGREILQVVRDLETQQDQVAPEKSHVRRQTLTEIKQRAKKVGQN